jgi:heat shock protein HslJ
MNQQRQAHRPLSHVAWPCAVLLAGMAGATVNAADLASAEWQLTQVRTEVGLTSVVEGAGPSVWRFGDGRVSGSAGCNRLLGGYRLDGDALSFEPNLAGTMMACPPPLMAQEQAVIAALGVVAGYALNDAGLALTDARGDTVLTFAEIESIPLTGTDWRLVQYNNGKGGLASVLADTAVVLRLDDDWTLQLPRRALFAEDVPLADIAERFGTPCYVYSARDAGAPLARLRPGLRPGART